MGISDDPPISRRKETNSNREMEFLEWLNKDSQKKAILTSKNDKRQKHARVKRKRKRQRKGLTGPTRWATQK